MIYLFEQLARRHPRSTCFTFESHNFTYAQVRLYAAGLADALQRRGVKRKSAVVCDMENCPAFVFLAFAAAYGGFSLVALNHRLTKGEKAERIANLQRSGGVDVALHLDEAGVMRLVDEARGAGAASTLTHHAQRFAAMFSPQQIALIMFTSGTSGKPKAVPLSWENLVGSAKASNAILNEPGQGVWQLVLPLYHVGGFQVMVRALCNDMPFVLYRRFEAVQMLQDALLFKATHVSVVDKMLQDVLSLALQDTEASDALVGYRCVLLGGAAPNPHTLERGVLAGARIYASYGMTETSSQIASRLVTRDFAGQLDLLPGYQATIIGPDAEGVGQLAVKGPGVFSGYLNVRAAFTADGFFLTGDSARMRHGRLRVAERTQDMFVSGGENIYPAEIQAKLMQIEGVADAYVFGVPDEVWGRRPVAFVERADRGAEAKPEGNRDDDSNSVAPSSPLSLQGFSAQVEGALQGELSRLYFPQCICAMEVFPRTGIGKVDRAALRKLYRERLEVVRIELFRIKQPLVAPIRTAKTVLEERESLIVRVTDYQGRTGLGECVAFSSDWYLPETIEDDARVLQDQLIPQVLRSVYVHPDEVTASFAVCEDAATHPLACAALEPALWDLYGKIVEQPLWRLIGGIDDAAAVRVFDDDSGSVVDVEDVLAVEPEGAKGGTKATDYRKEGSGGGRRVLGGIVLGIADVAETLTAVQHACDAGYTRVKIKICPGNDFEVLAAVRAAFPDVMLMADANQSYGEEDLEALRKLDGLNLRCIEEPLRLNPAENHSSWYARLAALQRQMTTTLCLDESIVTLEDVRAALAFPELRCFVVKIAKFGGIAVALAFCQWAGKRGIEVWLGGMYDTGVSKRMHAAFQTLPHITIPGDLNDSARYFPRDITIPPFALERGAVMINTSQHPFGLGCDLDDDAVNAVALTRYSFTLGTE
ncbi:MAG: AMP-binding protein [Raoultibacter sp.]